MAKIKLKIQCSLQLKMETIQDCFTLSTRKITNRALSAILMVQNKVFCLGLSKTLTSK
jgi:hypothetical protein